MKSPLAGQRSLPRLRVAPKAAESDGDDASFLASRYGLTPDDWQADVLDDWLGRRKDGRWAASTAGAAVPRQNGKNGLIEVRELYGMAVLGEKFLHTAHEVKTARKAFLRIASFFENPREFPELAALVREVRKTNGQEAVILNNGGSVEFIARSRGSGRGFTVDVLVCDEAQDLTDEELAALLPTISASPSGNPQVIITGTPPDPEKPGQGEVFRRVRTDAQENRDARLAFVDFGVADGSLPDVDDRDLWQGCNPALGIRLAFNEVERERALMAPETFARERLGWWGDPEAAEQGPIDLTKWASLLDRSIPQPSRAWVRLDVAPNRDYSTIGVAWWNGENIAVMVRCGTGSAWVVPELQQIMAQRQIDEIAIAPRSQAAVLVPDLINAGIAYESLSSTQDGDACAWAQTAITEGLIRHLGQAELDAAVAQARIRFVDETQRWDRKTRSANISPLIAGLGAAHRASLAGAPYNLMDSFG